MYLKVYKCIFFTACSINTHNFLSIVAQMNNYVMCWTYCPQRRIQQLCLSYRVVNARL